jgi:hypothetical protein
MPIRVRPQQKATPATLEGERRASKKSDDKDKPCRALTEKLEPHTAEVAFDQIMDAILGADRLRKHPKS